MAMISSQRLLFAIASAALIANAALSAPIFDCNGEVFATQQTRVIDSIHNPGEVVISNCRFDGGLSLLGNTATFNYSTARDALRRNNNVNGVGSSVSTIIQLANSTVGGEEAGSAGLYLSDLLIGGLMIDASSWVATLTLQRVVVTRRILVGGDNAVGELRVAGASFVTLNSATGEVEVGSAWRMESAAANAASANGDGGGSRGSSETGTTVIRDALSLDVPLWAYCTMGFLFVMCFVLAAISLNMRGAAREGRQAKKELNGFLVARTLSAASSNIGPGFTPPPLHHAASSNVGRTSISSSASDDHQHNLHHAHNPLASSHGSGNSGGGSGILSPRSAMMAPKKSAISFSPAASMEGGGSGGGHTMPPVGALRRDGSATSRTGSLRSTTTESARMHSDDSDEDVELQDVE